MSFLHYGELNVHQAVNGHGLFLERRLPHFTHIWLHVIQRLRSNCHVDIPTIRGPSVMILTLFLGSFHRRQAGVQGNTILSAIPKRVLKIGRRHAHTRPLHGLAHSPVASMDYRPVQCHVGRWWEVASTNHLMGRLTRA